MLDEIKRNKKYTIISATYNVERYLDKFFKAIVAQSLIFEKNIYIIIVDDGSTDNSQNIIKKWIQKYPQNIQYIKKENGGQSSARNLGLLHVKTKWVTFIDPDDFISNRYFEIIHNFLNRNTEKKISLVSCKLIYYFEQWHVNIDYHPLRYNFQEKENIVMANNLKDKIQLSVSSAIFNTKLINNIELKFDIRIKPNFEDAHFIGKYLLAYPESSIVFLKRAKYFYRKRKNATSTIDNSWGNSSKYNEVLYFGYLDLFKSYRKKVGIVPKHIQRMVLYDLMWHYKRHIKSPETISFLSHLQKEHYQFLLHKLFESIDIQTILDFKLAGCDFSYKVAFLHLYKNNSVPYQIMYIDKFSKNHKKLYCHYFSILNESCLVYVDGCNLVPISIKEEKFKFMNKEFVTRYSLEFILDSKSKNIQIEIDSVPTYINNYGNKVSEIQNIKSKRSKKLQSFVKYIGRKVLLNG